MSQGELLQLRDVTYKDDKLMQELLAPYEHRAFTREATKDNKLMAAPIAAALPFYQLYKLLGLSSARTAPSLEQLKSGYRGIYEGLVPVAPPSNKGTTP